MADESRDLANVVQAALCETFAGVTRGEYEHAPTVDDALKFMINLAAFGVAISLEEFVDTSEHGIQLVYNHGANCLGCQHIQAIAFDAIKRTQ